MVNVNVTLDGMDLIVLLRSAQRIAMDMAIALTRSVYAKSFIMAKIAKYLADVQTTVIIAENVKMGNASVTLDGGVRIVLDKYALTTAIQEDCAKIGNVNVKLGGRDLTVASKNVKEDV